MFNRKILMSPVLGLLITVIVFNLFLPVVCFADETDQSGQENVNKTYNHKTSGVIVSMGDSYSAGEGIQPFYGSRYSEGWELQDWLAHRSEGSWGGQLRLPDVGSMNSSKYPEDANPHWYFVASSGAVTWDIMGVERDGKIIGQGKDYYKWDETTNSAIVRTETIDPQIDIFKKTRERQIVPDYITITLGGNDLGFVEILTTAAINDFWIDPCWLSKQLAEAVNDLCDFEIKDDKFVEVRTENSDESNELQSDDKVRERIKKIYKKIDEAASIGDDHPCILVAGYPHLLNEDFSSAEDKANALAVFTPRDAHQINLAIDLYTEVLQNIVKECQNEGLRIEYVDISEFDGHEVNTADPWVNGLEFNSSHLGGLGVLPMLKDQVFSSVAQDLLRKTLGDDYKKNEDLMYLLIEEKIFGNLTSGAIREILGIDYNQDLKYDLVCGASLHPNSDGANGYKECFQRKINELEGLAETPSDDPPKTETRIGSEITMGNYRGEDIEWVVLDVKDDNLLVISKDIIEAKPFNKEDADVTWETCSLRQWLNEDFYQTAFSSSEREHIQKTHVVTPDNPTSGADGGNDTDDYCFLLSIDEANKYFSSDEERKVKVRDYISESDLHTFDGYSFWHLRSPSSISLDRYDKYAHLYHAEIGASGNIDEWGCEVCALSGIRPAMWIDKNQEPASGAGSDPTSADKATLSRDGDFVVFGHYEQDGNTENGKEPIEWEIVTEQDGKMLLISKYILDCQPYNTEETEVTWETCSLRQWLNNDFYNTAFNESERRLIETTTLSNPDNPFGGEGGNSTDDKVFCLSVEEVYRYLDILYSTDNNPYGGDFSFSLDFLREVTQYARDRGVVHLVMPEGYFDFTQVPIDESDLIGKDFGNWWLRSPAYSNKRACVVFLSGQAGYEIEEYVQVGSEGVRPAIWVSCDDIKDPSSEITTPVPDEVKAAYLDVVNNISYEDFKSEYYGVPSSGKFSFDLVYVDNDDIPELLVCLTISGGPNGDEVFANLYTIGNDNKAVKLFQRWAADRFDANTVYYPRENMVKEFSRSGASNYFIDIVSIDETSKQSKFSYYEQIYDWDDSSIVNYYIYDNEKHKTISEITKLEFEALTTCPGDPVPLVANRTLQEIKDVLK